MGQGWTKAIEFVNILAIDFLEVRIWLFSNNLELNSGSDNNKFIINDAR